MEDGVGVVEDVFRPPGMLEIAFAVGDKPENKFGAHLRDERGAEVGMSALHPGTHFGIKD